MLNFLLLLLGIAWAVLLVTLNWQRLGLNRFILLSFALAFASTLAIRYGNTVERYFYGANYFRDYVRPQFGLSNGALIAAAFAFGSGSLLFVGLSFRSGVSRPKRRLLGIAIALVLAAALSLLLWPLWAVLAWTCIPTLAIGSILIFLAKQSGAKPRGLFGITIAIALHLCFPWVYVSWLDEGYRAGFEGGFAEAVQNNVDIPAIHQWMQLQGCESWEISQQDAAYASLPRAIRRLQPTDVAFTAHCRDKKAAQLILGYPSTWMDAFGLAIVYPPIQSHQVEAFHQDDRGHLLPISDRCSCYIYSPSK